MLSLAPQSPAPPQLKNVNIIDKEEARFSGATYVATADDDAGSAQPEAAPKSMRAATRPMMGCDMSVDAGMRAMANDHSARPPRRTRAPPNLSPSTPPSTWVTPYPHRKADWSKPGCRGASSEQQGFNLKALYALSVLRVESMSLSS